MAGYIDNPSKVDAFALDASINWETENWTISLFGKNLTDEVYLMSFLDVGANVVAAGPNNATPGYAPGLWSFGTPNRPRYWSGGSAEVLIGCRERAYGAFFMGSADDTTACHWVRRRVSRPVHAARVKSGGTSYVSVMTSTDRAST